MENVVQRNEIRQKSSERGSDLKRFAHVYLLLFRVLQDHTTSSGVQYQALDSLKQKLSEAEETLRREQESGRLIQVKCLFLMCCCARNSPPLFVPVRVLL